VIGYFGTTISPYLFFWQASEEVEEEFSRGAIDANGERLKPLMEEEIRSMRTDTVIGMVISQAVTFFIVTCTAATLHATGKTDIETAQDAARALLPLGHAAYFLFTAGIVGVGLLAIPTLAGSVGYAVAETASWPQGLYLRFGAARRFYGVIIATIGIGYALNFVHSLSPIKGLLYSAAFNGITAPPLVVLLLFICNNREIVGNRKNGWAANLFGIATAVIMGTSAVYFLWMLATGRAG
jgi:Mn2+/Fe2+ NRAMP family transporter